MLQSRFPYLLTALLLLASCMPSAPIDDADELPPPSSDGSAEQESETKQYENDDIGLRFQYRVSPDGYTLFEQETDDGYGIVLMNTAAFQAVQNQPGTDGPESIHILVFPNPDQMDVQSWASTVTMHSNLQESSVPEQFSVDGRDGIQYQWDGLYPGRSVVVTAYDRIYLFSLAADGASLRLRADFEALLESVELSSD